MRRFAGIDLGNEPVPDKTTLCKFRHLLEKHDHGARLFEMIGEHLEEAGLKVRTGGVSGAPCRGAAQRKTYFSSPVIDCTYSNGVMPFHCLKARLKLRKSENPNSIATSFT